MLTHVDRIVLAVRERRPVVRALQRLFGAEVVSDGPLPVRAAERTTLRAGVGEIEVLSPKGVGLVADFIGRKGPGIFALGFATDDLERSRSHLESQAVSFNEGDDHLFVTSDKGADLPGLHLVITAARPRASVGLLQRFCGATLLHRFVEPEKLLRSLSAHPSELSRVETAGFTGSVIHFGQGLLSHLAILAPSGLNSPIARSFYQRGPGIYQVSAITEQLSEVRKRLATRGQAEPSASADEPILLTSRLLGEVQLALLPSSPSCSSRDIPSSLLAMTGAAIEPVTPCAMRFFRKRRTSSRWSASISHNEDHSDPRSASSVPPGGVRNEFHGDGAKTRDRQHGSDRGLR